MSQISKTREMLKNEFISSLEQNQLPWERGWTVINCYNPVTNNVYKGVNALLLEIVSEKNGLTDPRWMTYKQIKDKGFSLIDAKGTGVPVEFWSPYDKELKKNITQQEANQLIKEGLKDRVFYTCRFYYVFNAKYIKGIEPLQVHDTIIENKSIESFILNYLKNEDIRLQHGGNHAFYSPNEDSITIPAVDHFKNERYYFDTILHEIGHSTGHTKRMNRDLFGVKGSERYAKEELRAELYSSFITAELGLKTGEKDLNRHKAYIQSWIQLIKNKPNELFKAFKDTEDMIEFVKERGDFNKIIQLGITDKRIKKDEGNLNKMSIKKRTEQAKQILNSKKSNHKLDKEIKKKIFI